MDFPGVGKRIFRAPGFSVPNGEKDIASIYDLLIPSLKRTQNHFTSKFCPVGKELEVSDPHRFRSLKSERIDSPGAACNDLGYFSAFQTVLPAKGAKVLILHSEVRDEVKFRNRPASGNSKFHKRGAPVRITEGTTTAPSRMQKGAPALYMTARPFNMPSG